MWPPIIQWYPQRGAAGRVGPAADRGSAVRACAPRQAGAGRHRGHRGSLVERELTTGPERLRDLVGEARASAGRALADLRHLVRGIHPPVLADRGLGGAIEAAALLCPLPVDVVVDLDGRPPQPVESALYLAAVEAITNITRHSRATRAWIRLAHSDDRLRLTVTDNGTGGASPEGNGGTGLAGIRRRLATFDGTLAISSTAGGPTRITMEVPCELSSPRISPCSGTA